LLVCFVSTFALLLFSSKQDERMEEAVIAEIIVGSSRRSTKSLPDMMIQISVQPRIFYLKSVITPEECVIILKEAQPHFERSLTVGGEKPIADGGRVDEDRTSNGMFMFTPEQIALVDPVASRVARAVGIPKQHFEAMQILRYQIGQQYLPHTDFFQ